MPMFEVQGLEKVLQHILELMQQLGWTGGCHELSHQCMHTLVVFGRFWTICI